MIWLLCFLFTAGILIYVFAPGSASAHADKSQLAFLQERKEVVYENLRDLNFDYKAGKFPQQDYDSLRGSLETEAAEILKKIEALS